VVPAAKGGIVLYPNVLYKILPQGAGFFFLLSLIPERPIETEFNSGALFPPFSGMEAI
jgi:hypothetical protein